MVKALWFSRMTHPKGIIDFIIVVRRCVLCVPFLSTAFVLTWRWNSVHVAQRYCQSFTKTIIILSKETPFSHLKEPLALSQFKKHSKFGCPKFQISRARKLSLMTQSGDGKTEIQTQTQCPPNYGLYLEKHIVIAP